MEKGKLVRDRIPVIIKKGGRRPITHVATDKEYAEKLKEKLREEVDEFLASGKKEELADIVEVINALCDMMKLERAELETIRRKKSVQRGGFTGRVILDAIE